MKLRIRGLHATQSGNAATLGIDNGRVYVASDDDTAAEELKRIVANELFVTGLGFAKLRRDPVSDALVRTPETGRTELERWVRIGEAHPDDVLLAIRDNLEITGQFRVDVLR